MGVPVMLRINLFASGVVLISGLMPLCAPAQNVRELFNGRDLTGWEVRGHCVWTALTGGILAGTRTHPDNVAFSWPMDQKQFQAWRYKQAWLYTLDNFDEFDLELEYWIPPGGNSGVSIRDTSRGECAVGQAPTPSHIGYEMQIAKGGKYPAGSVYVATKNSDRLAIIGLDWHTKILVEHCACGDGTGCRSRGVVQNLC